MPAVARIEGPACRPAIRGQAITAHVIATVEDWPRARYRLAPLVQYFGLANDLKDLLGRQVDLHVCLIAGGVPDVLLGQLTCEKLAPNSQLARSDNSCTGDDSDGAASHKKRA